MGFPYDTPGLIPFTKIQLDDWIRLYQPKSIDMTDRQYARLCIIVGYNPREYRGIRIQFENAPNMQV